MTPKSRVGYVDATDFYHELGEVECSVYPTLTSIMRDVPCAEECGVIKVEIRFLKYAEIPAKNPDYLSYADIERKSPKYKEHILRDQAHLQTLKQRLLDRVSYLEKRIQKNEEDLAKMT